VLPPGWAGAADEQFNTVDADGKFVLVNMAPRGHKVLVAGLPSPYYVKEVRYGGAAAEKGVVPLGNTATNNLLEILVDDKPAAVWGTVSHGGQPVKEPFVVLSRWPADFADPSSIRTVKGDEDGQFQF